MSLHVTFIAAPTDEARGLYLADRMASLETRHVVAAGPDQPQLFSFPKRSFESKKVVKRS